MYQDQMWHVTAKGTLRPLLQVTGLVIILFSHKRAVVFSSQEVQYNRMYKLWPNPHWYMLFQIMGQWFKAQYCSEWTELWYGMHVWFLVPRWPWWPNQSCAILLSSSSIYHWLIYNVCKSDTSRNRLKVPFAVTHHKYKTVNMCEVRVFLWLVQGSSHWKTIVSSQVMIVPHEHAQLDVTPSLMWMCYM